MRRTKIYHRFFPPFSCSPLLVRSFFFFFFPFLLKRMKKKSSLPFPPSLQACKRRRDKRSRLPFSPFSSSFEKERKRGNSPSFPLNLSFFSRWIRGKKLFLLPLFLHVTSRFFFSNLTHKSIAACRPLPSGPARYGCEPGGNIIQNLRVFLFLFSLPFPGSPR